MNNNLCQKLENLYCIRDSIVFKNNFETYGKIKCKRLFQYFLSEFTSICGIIRHDTGMFVFVTNISSSRNEYYIQMMVIFSCKHVTAAINATLNLRFVFSIPK